MSVDTYLAIAAAVVAIFGTITNPGGWTKFFLVVMALSIAGAAIRKGQNDEADKKFMRAALESTISPTPSAIKTMYADFVEVGKRNYYSDVDYYRVNDGMVVYVGKGGQNSGAIVIDNSELGQMYGNIISRTSNLEYVIKLFKQKFDFSEFEEDLYARLCILARTTARKFLQKDAGDCVYDDQTGITLTIDINGKATQIVVTPADISRTGGTRPQRINCLLWADCSWNALEAKENEDGTIDVKVRHKSPTSSHSNRTSFQCRPQLPYHVTTKQSHGWIPSTASHS